MACPLVLYPSHLVSPLGETLMPGPYIQMPCPALSMTARYPANVHYELHGIKCRDQATIPP